MRILVTAGPTREFLDSIRFLSNPSSGRMGYAVAREAARRGHGVSLISGPVSLPIPAGVQATRVITAAEMFEACTRLFADCQAAVMVAAVCDYRPVDPWPQKRRKDSGVISLTLEPTEDICAYLGRIKAHRVVIGFALEDHDHHAHAEEKLRRKYCDAIVLGGPGNLEGETAEIEILRTDGGWSPPLNGDKEHIALAIVDLAEELVRARQQAAG